MRIAIAAIFKNECEYILEWIAYHRSIIGINDFFIADNVSDDGSSQLLEALDEAGVIKRVFFPRKSENEGPQIPAYNFIIEQYKSEIDYFLFIDADEFLVNNTDQSLNSIISQCASVNNFGALALNWRIFGSNGNTFKSDGLVIERFYRASKKDEKVNSHIKSLVSSKAITKMHIHQADLCDNKVYLNETQQHAIFLNRPSDTIPCVDNISAPFTQTINNSFLYIAHFAVKSKSEHFSKKASRGSAGGSASREKGRQYFIGHDLNQEKCLDLYKHSDKVEHSVKEIKKLLKLETPYFSYIRVNVDHKDERLSGWVSSDFEGPLVIQCLLDSSKLVELPLNTIRKDVYGKKLSSREKCGFSYTWDKIGKYNQSFKAWIKGSNLVFIDIAIS